MFTVEPFAIMVCSTTNKNHLKGSNMDIEKLIFAMIVEDFDTVKELYSNDKPIEAYEAYKEILLRVHERTSSDFDVATSSIDGL